MRALFYFDWLTTPIHLFTWNLFKAIKLHWTGQTPSLALSLKFLEDIQELPNECQLSLLNYTALEVIKKQTSYFQDMELNENLEEEKKLLAASSLKWFPHETAQIRIINSQGEEFTSSIYHGSRSSIGSVDLLRKEVKDLIFKARKKGLMIEEVEVAHTHPSLEVMIETKEGSNFVFNGLSNSDRRLGELLSPFLDYPLRIKAITPAANYSLVF